MYRAIALTALLGLAGVTPAFGAPCRFVMINGQQAEVCDGQPAQQAPVVVQPYANPAFLEGMRQGGAAARLRMFLDAQQPPQPPGPPPTLPPGGADVVVTGSKVHGTVRMVTDASGLSGCALLSAVRDDEFPDLAEKVLKLGGTHALLTGTKGKYVFASAFRCP